MAKETRNPLQQLKAGDVVGPEHHKFKLSGSPSDCALGKRWLANDLTTNTSTEVSLFFIKPEYARNKAFQEEFKTQIIRCKSLKFTHLANVFGYFVHNKNLLFFATEKLDGKTLDDLIRTKELKKLKPQQKQGLLKQTALALDFQYKKVQKPHGAISPDLIYLNNQEGVKFLPLSFKELIPEELTSAEPKSKNLPTSNAYLAYQAAEAFHPGQTERKSDVYSLASIAYTLFNGKAAFECSDDETSRSEKVLDVPTALSTSQWSTLQAGLSLKPDVRPTSCVQLVEALFPISDDVTDEDTSPDSEQSSLNENTADKAASPTQNIKNWLKRLPLRAIIFFLSGLIIGLSIGFLWFFQEQAVLKADLEAWKSKASRIKQLYEDQSLATKILQDKVDAYEQPPAKPSPARESVAIEHNFTVFQDPLSQGAFGPKMISLPAGYFTMGDTTEVGDDNERPVKTINITKPFALSKFEVTFAEYDLFAKATKRSLPKDNGWGRGQQPVINVSWRDAKAYADWLAKQTGQPYRLPNEAEWEYAARAGTSTAYWWGNELEADMAICDECQNTSNKNQPMPVGSLTANPWGFHDMNGNVDEWVQDCYAETLASYPTNGKTHTSLSCSNRSMRGGSWFDIGRVIRSASRYRHPATASRDTWGFRIAVDLNE